MKESRLVISTQSVNQEHKTITMAVKLISYNSTGLSPLTVDFMRDMIDKEKPDFLLIQETFTMQSTEHKVLNIHPDYLAHAVSGVDERQEYLHGRPSSGVAILWNKSLGQCVQRIKTTALSYKTMFCKLNSE